MPEDNELNEESQYLLSRQIAEEYNSPFMEWVRKVKSDTAIAEEKIKKEKAEYEKGKKTYIESARAKGKGEKVIQESFGELEEPILDPVMAFAGGAGGMFKMSMRAGMKLMPSLGRAVTSGIVGGAADYPIGAISEALEVKAPGLAIPFALTVGLISGVTLESAIERGVFKIAQKAGKEITKEAMKTQVKQIRGILASESGEVKFGKGYDKKTHKAVVDEINKEIGEVPISKVKGGKTIDVEKAVESVLEPHGSVLSQFAHGKEKLIKTNIGIRTVTTKRGKEYKLNAYTYEFADGRQRIVLATDPTNLIDAGAIVRPVKNGVVIESLHGGKTGLPGLGGTLTRLIKRKFGKIIPDSEAPLSPAGRKATKKLQAQQLKKPIEIGDFLKAQPDIVKKMSKSGEIREFAANLNLSRVENAEQLSKIYGKTVKLFKKELGEATRGYRSNKRTEEAAEMLGMTPKKLLKRRKGQAFNAEEATAARFMLASSADNLSKLAKKVQTLEATDIDKFEFQKALNLHYAIQAQVQGMTAEAGRALQAFRIPAKTEAFKIKQIGDVLKSMPEGVSPEKMANAISTMGDVGKLTNFTRNVQRATTKDMFLEAWINGLLSGPQTHFVNMMSNTLTAMWQVPERFLAGTIGRITPGPQAIKEAEAITQAFGLVEGFKDGIKLFTKTMVTGEPSDALSKIELKRYRSITAENIKQLPVIKKLAPNALEEGGVAARAVDFMGAGIRLPGRALMAEDELFKAIGYRMELNAQAYRMATDEGLKGKAFARRVMEIKSDPEALAPNVHAAAVDAARYQTFTNPLESKLLQALSKTDSAALRIVVPFIRTPTNIVKFAFERTPLAPFMKSVRADIASGGAARDLALARLSLGSMTMATVATLAASGQITGGGPSNSKLKGHLYNQGWKPYSVKVGDYYYPYGRLEPIGMIFGLAADSVEIMGQLSDEERDSLATMIVGSISKNITSKTWLRGVSDALEALNDPDRYGEQWTRRLAGTVIPTGVSQIERVISPEMEAVNGYMDQIKSRLPGWSTTLPVARNLWGDAIIPGAGLSTGIISATYNLISPIKRSKIIDSPVDKELFELKAPLSMPNKTQQIKGIPVKLTPQEYDTFIILMNKVEVRGGKNLKESLNQLVKHGKSYKKLNNDRKIQRIQSYFNEAKDKARAKLYEKSSEIQEYVEMERQNVE